MEILAPIGRVLFSSIFILSGFSHFKSETRHHARSQGVSKPEVTVPFSGIMIIVGGIMVALGWKVFWGAGLIALFLIIVTPKMHAFWKIQDPMMHQMQMINFMKNLSLLGAALLLMYFGAGPFALGY